MQHVITSSDFILDLILYLTTSVMKDPTTTTSTRSDDILTINRQVATVRYTAQIHKQSASLK